MRINKGERAYYVIWSRGDDDLTSRLSRLPMFQLFFLASPDRATERIWKAIWELQYSPCPVKARFQK